MIYNLSNQFDVQSARVRLDALCSRGCIIELTEKKQKRSISQNSYLHVALGYFASQVGETLDYVKRFYYKLNCNRDLFVMEKSDSFLGVVKYLRSSADLTTEEMSLSIDRFRNWASTVGIYIPEASNEAEVAAMAIEVEKYKTYLY
jgi:hypothetical protein